METEQETEPSSEQMLTLAERVDNWKAAYPDFVGSLEKLNFEIERALNTYFVRATYKGIYVGDYKIERRHNQRIKELYRNAKTIAKANREREKYEALKIAQENKERERNEAVKYAMSLL